MKDFEGFDKEPLATRNSDIYGEVQLFSPDAPAAEWHDLPFMLVTEKGGWEVVRKDVERINPDSLVMEARQVATGKVVKSGTGVRLLVVADKAHAAFERPSLLSMSDLWEDATAEVMTAI